MKSALPCVLTINGGSSSIRFAVYEAGDTPRRRLDGKIDRIGLSGTNLIVNDPAGTPQVSRARAHHQSCRGREAHAGVDALAVAHGGQAGAIAEMCEDYAALRRAGIDAAKLLHQVGEGESVKAVALDALFRIAPRDRQ